MNNQIYQIGAPVALAAVLNLIGFAIKKSPIPNWAIPLIIMAIGGAAFPQIADYSKITYECKNPQILMALFGVGIGGVSVGLHQGLKQFIDRKEVPDLNGTDQLQNPPKP